ncbi:hypothetical protein [Cumulibacter manganitolerans]|uniref:hypothetical protein n=1 Tax=Cumulibacter manganitolerans TaxID=1884992 RepID=UPI001295773F|nr:hypothetical protein [Cumulibacter manganitolerans]
MRPPTPRRSIALGAVLVLVGLAGILLAFGPAQFADRLSGRVEAVGTVQWGISADAQSGDEQIADGQYGAWKVDYEIDGSPHTGLLLGTYRAGQQVRVSAPEDGSIYALLHPGVSTPVKVLSWFLVPLSLAAGAVGVWSAARGIRQRDETARAEARAQLARRYPQLYPPQPTPAAAPTPPPPPRPANDFYAPYDI